MLILYQACTVVVRMFAMFTVWVYTAFSTEYLRTKEAVMATARLDIRLDEEVKAKAEKASALLGLKSLTDYVVRLMDNDATEVISKYESITVEDNIFDTFMSACDKAQAPNKALLDAVKLTNDSGF